MAQSIGADAVLCACSSIGGAMGKAAELITVPVLRIDEPMAKKQQNIPGLVLQLHLSLQLFRLEY